MVVIVEIGDRLRLCQPDYGADCPSELIHVHAAGRSVGEEGVDCFFLLQRHPCNELGSVFCYPCLNAVGEAVEGKIISRRIVCVCRLHGLQPFGGELGHYHHSVVLSPLLQRRRVKVAVLDCGGYLCVCNRQLLIASEPSKEIYWLFFRLFQVVLQPIEDILAGRAFGSGFK